jgi:hypothetical protein
MRDVINTNNISKLSQLPYKQHVYTQDNSIEPTPTEPNPSLLRSDSNKVAIVELDFKVEANKNKFYQYRALPHYCEFKYSMGEDRVLWIERIISSGDPQLDMELERVVKDKILNSLQWSNSGRVKVNLVY